MCSLRHTFPVLETPTSGSRMLDIVRGTELDVTDLRISEGVSNTE